MSRHILSESGDRFNRLDLGVAVVIIKIVLNRVVLISNMMFGF